VMWQAPFRYEVVARLSEEEACGGRSQRCCRYCTCTAFSPCPSDTCTRQTCSEGLYCHTHVYKPCPP
jgi:hypothetical protein